MKLIYDSLRTHRYSRAPDVNLDLMSSSVTNSSAGIVMYQDGWAFTKDIPKKPAAWVSVKPGACTVLYLGKGIDTGIAVEFLHSYQHMGVADIDVLVESQSRRAESGSGGGGGGKGGEGGKQTQLPHDDDDYQQQGTLLYEEAAVTRSSSSAGPSVQSDGHGGRQTSLHTSSADNGGSAWRSATSVVHESIDCQWEKRVSLRNTSVLTIPGKNHIVMTPAHCISCMCCDMFV